ncbi:tektin-1 [Schistocerca americana]|uniref:tektin-1 n=1 Tax=Schistocerca americana TaxID=7009 RepID=UPI001F4FA3CC|nr:tektin-1 [Schistocerca americana]
MEAIEWVDLLLAKELQWKPDGLDECKLYHWCTKIRFECPLKPSSRRNKATNQEELMPAEAPGYVLSQDDPYPSQPAVPRLYRLPPDGGSVPAGGVGQQLAEDSVPSALPVPPPYLPQPEDLPEPQLVPTTAWRSEPEWRAHNSRIMSAAAAAVHTANLSDTATRQCMERSAATTDASQRASTEQLRARAHSLHCALGELSRAADAAAGELSQLLATRRRLRAALDALRLPACIVAECLDRRRDRPGAELVADCADRELRKEQAMLSEAAAEEQRLLEQLESQKASVMAAKARLEADWSDKRQAHHIEAANVALRNASRDLFWRPGAVREPMGQTDEASWAAMTRENVSVAAAEVRRSEELRGRVDATLAAVSRALRSQADAADAALAERAAHTDQCARDMQADLLQVLERTAATEQQIADVKQALRNHEVALRKVQTRLHARLARPGAENCRDAPQAALLEEARQVQENVGAQQVELRRAQAALAALVARRAGLEHEIACKQRALAVDRRCRALRADYPSTTALAGY